MSRELTKQNTSSKQYGVEVEMGTKVSQNPVDKYRIGEGARDLMTVLTKKPIITRTIYCEEIGYKFHAIKEAEEAGLEVKIHYNFLVVVWNSDKAGNKIIDDKYTLFVLSVAEKVYNRLVTKYELNGDLSKLVLQVGVERGMEQYQSLMFEVHTQIKPPFLVNKALFTEIKEKFIEYKSSVPRVIASTITPQEFLEKTTGTGDRQFENTGKVTELDNSIQEVDFEEVDFEEVEKKAISDVKAKKEVVDKSDEFFNEEDVNFTD